VRTKSLFRISKSQWGSTGVRGAPEQANLQRTDRSSSRGSHSVVPSDASYASYRKLRQESSRRTPLRGCFVRGFRAWRSRSPQFPQASHHAPSISSLSDSMICFRTKSKTAEKPRRHPKVANPARNAADWLHDAVNLRYVSAARHTGHFYATVARSFTAAPPPPSACLACRVDVSDRW
jgi:hypothetical protein